MVGSVNYFNATFHLEWTPSPKIFPKPSQLLYRLTRLSENKQKNLSPKLKSSLATYPRCSTYQLNPALTHKFVWLPLFNLAPWWSTTGNSGTKLMLRKSQWSASIT